MSLSMFCRAVAESLNGVVGDRFCDGCVVAFSGGVDSLCLLLAVSEVCALRGIEVWAVVVDHGLTECSGRRASEAYSLASEIVNVKPVVLRWAGVPEGAGNVELRARDARYRLICNFALGLGIKAVLTGHHLNDRAEGAIMRLGMGFGLAGLRGMSRVSFIGGCTIVRPFLDFSKGSISGFVRASYCNRYVLDPMNSDTGIYRNRIRELGQEVLSNGEMGFRAALSFLEMDYEVILDRVKELFSRFCKVDPGTACCYMNPEVFNALDTGSDVVCRRILYYLFFRICGSVISGWSARASALDRLVELSRQGGKGVLGGVCMQKVGSGIYFFRELGRLPSGKRCVFCFDLESYCKGGSLDFTGGELGLRVCLDGSGVPLGRIGRIFWDRRFWIGFTVDFASVARQWDVAVCSLDSVVRDLPTFARRVVKGVLLGKCGGFSNANLKSLFSFPALELSRKGEGGSCSFSFSDFECDILSFHPVSSCVFAEGGREIGSGELRQISMADVWLVLRVFLVHCAGIYICEFGDALGVPVAYGTGELGAGISRFVLIEYFYNEDLSG